MRKNQIRRRILRREGIAILITVWFAVAIALIENGLEDDLNVADTEITNDSCARTDSFYDFSSLNLIDLPYFFSIDNWSLDTAKNAACEKKGLAPLNFGGANGTILSDGAVSIQAPLCRNASDDSHNDLPEFYRGEAKVNSMAARYHLLGLSTINPRIQILPYGETVGVSRIRMQEVDENYVALLGCDRHNISSIPMRYHEQWNIIGVDDLNVSRVVLNTVCNSIDNSTRANVFVSIHTDLHGLAYKNTKS